MSATQRLILSQPKHKFDSPLNPGRLNIDEKIRSNLFAWRGQFSPQLIESLISCYAESEDVILDPFAGSGTVLYEAALLGHEVHGYELNPAAATLARAYLLLNRTRDEQKEILSTVERLLQGLQPRDPFEVTDLVDCSATNDMRIVMEAFVVFLDLQERAYSPEDIWAKWRSFRRVLDEVCVANGKRITAGIADARRLPVRDATFDFVVTSPPYINVFNYHHNYRGSVEALGWQPLVVAKSEIGANRKFRQNRFLTVAQYCLDMALALAELRRVLKPHGKVLMIVGRESQVQKTSFFNAAIVNRLATTVVGYKNVLTQERVFKNKFGQSIREDLLHLVVSGTKSSNAREIDEGARTVGRDVLVDGLNRVPDERRFFLEEAIASCGDVSVSPYFISERSRTY